MSSHFVVAIILVVAHVARANRPMNIVNLSEQGARGTVGDVEPLDARKTVVVNSTSSSLAALVNSSSRAYRLDHTNLSILNTSSVANVANATSSSLVARVNASATVKSDARQLLTLRQLTNARRSDKKCGKDGVKLKENCGNLFKGSSECSVPRTKCVGVFSRNCECEEGLCATPDGQGCRTAPKSCEELNMPKETGASKKECTEDENAEWTGFFSGKCKCKHGYCFQDGTCQSVRDEAGSQEAEDNSYEKGDESGETGDGEGDSADGRADDQPPQAMASAKRFHDMLAGDEELHVDDLAKEIDSQEDWDATQTAFCKKYRRDPEMACGEEGAGDLLACLEELEEEDLEKIKVVVEAKGVKMSQKVDCVDHEEANGEAGDQAGDDDGDEDEDSENSEHEEDGSVEVLKAGSSEVNGFYTRVDDSKLPHVMYEMGEDEDGGSLIQQDGKNNHRGWKNAKRASSPDREENASGKGSGNSSSNASESGTGAAHYISYYKGTHHTHAAWYIEKSENKERKRMYVRKMDELDEGELVPPTDGWALYMDEEGKGDGEAGEMPLPELKVKASSKAPVMDDDAVPEDDEADESSQETVYEGPLSSGDPCRTWRKKKLTQKQCEDWFEFGCRWRENKNGEMCYHTLALKWAKKGEEKKNKGSPEEDVDPDADDENSDSGKSGLDEDDDSPDSGTDDPDSDDTPNKKLPGNPKDPLATHD